MCHNGQGTHVRPPTFGGQVVGRVLTLRSASYGVCVSVLVVRVERCCELSGPATKMRCVCMSVGLTERSNVLEHLRVPCLVTSQCVNFFKGLLWQNKKNETEQEQIFITKSRTPHGC